MAQGASAVATAAALLVYSTITLRDGRNRAAIMHPPRPSSQSGQRWTPKDLMMVTVEPDFHRFSVLTALYLLGWIISCWAEVDTAWWNRGTDGESSSQPRAWRWVVTCTYMKQEFWVVLTLLDFFCCRTVKATIDLKQQFPNRITLNMTPKYRLGFLFLLL